MRWEWLATISLLAVEPARGDVDVVYVAVGGSAEVPGSARAGDPARIARRLEKSGLRVRLVDLTVPDAPLHAIRHEQLRRAVALRPTLVTVAIGPVDVAETSLRSFSRDLQIVADLLYRTKARVVIGNVMRAEQLRGGADRALRRRVDAFNWAIVRIARRHGFLLADVRAGRSGLSWEEAVGRAVDALARARTPPRRRARDRAAAPAAALNAVDRGAPRGGQRRSNTLGVGPSVTPVIGARAGYELQTLLAASRMLHKGDRAGADPRRARVGSRGAARPSSFVAREHRRPRRTRRHRDAGSRSRCVRGRVVAHSAERCVGDADLALPTRDGCPQHSWI